MTPKLKKELCEYRVCAKRQLGELPEYVFTDNQGERLSENSVKCMFKRLKTAVEKWDKAGVCIHLLDLSVNTCPAAGRAFLQMAAAFAEMERSLVKGRTESAMAVAEALNGDGVPAKKGGKWYASTVKAILSNTLHGAVA